MVRTPNLNSVLYSPSILPEKPTSEQITGEFRRVAAALAILASGHIDMTYTAPSKPRDGDIRLADGTSWNPGSGQGVYCYYNSAWNFLG